MAYNYDIAIIGAGSAGLACADSASLLGKKTILIDNDKLGGDCLWTGCVPSKAFLHAAKSLAYDKTSNLNEKFTEVKRKILTAQEQITLVHESKEAYLSKGIEVRFGPASFVDAHTLSVGDASITAKSILIATGSRPSVPQMPGVPDDRIITNETVFTLPYCPKRLLIVGGGPIGCEFAQAFAAIGAEVILLQRNKRLIPKDEPEASDLLYEEFCKAGIRVYLEANFVKAQDSNQELSVTINQNGKEEIVVVDAVVAAVGRTPNLASLGLEGVGVAFGPEGIIHNKYLQTSVPHIYAAGDVAGNLLFTHYAGFAGSIAAYNMSLPFKFVFSPAAIPWVTFTNPEIAHVGASQAQLDEAKTKYRIISAPYSAVDRACADGQTTGFFKLLVSPRGAILGVTIAGTRAGELIHEFALAIEHNLKIADLLGTIHAYPTYSFGIQQVLNADMREHPDFMVRIGRFLAKFT